MYSIARAAKWLGVAPWVLIERMEAGEEYWFQAALDFESAEIEAQNELRERARLNAKMGLG